MEFKDLLKDMMDKKASDLHIRANGAPVLRVDGDLRPVEGLFLNPQQTEQIAVSLMSPKQRKQFEDYNECDMSCSVPGLGRFRVNAFRQRGTVNIALRVVPTDIPPFETLGLPNVVKKLADTQRGLILVTGTTGSGKSTTLASIVDIINSTRSVHIVTIEDPIEFLHRDKKAIISQRELGMDTSNYAEALRHVVRQDPDVILVGEMRDLETMAAALTAAQTGHLVLSTIHTIDTVQTVSRIVDLFPPHQQNQIRYMLSDTLKGVISQRLLPKASGQGRVPSVEVLVVTALVKKLIEENNLAEISNVQKQGAFYGMQTFNQSLVKLYQDGHVKLEHALAAASNPEEIMMAVRGIETGTDAEKFFEQ